MGDAHDCPDLIACSPVGYSYVDQPRPRADNTGLHTNHGGVVLFYRDDLRARQIELPEYKSFEAIGAFLHCPRFSDLTIVVYRPGSVSVSDDFFEDCGDLLECISTYSDLRIIGDINIHLAVLAEQSTIKFQQLIDVHDLTQHVVVPTHSLSHALDVLITRAEQIVNTVSVDSPTLSDHSQIVGVLAA